MRTRLLLICYLLFFSCNQAWAEKIYKCKNAKGVLIYASAPCAADVEALNTWTVIHRSLQPTVELIIKQDDSGHYLSNGTVNGQAVSFIVDTGASKVSLPLALAQAANINCQTKVEINTANGTSEACNVTIPQFKFGPFLLQNVEAIIAPNLTQPLLGMNVLEQYKIAQNQGEMHISQR